MEIAQVSSTAGRPGISKKRQFGKQRSPYVIYKMDVDWKSTSSVKSIRRLEVTSGPKSIE